MEAFGSGERWWKRLELVARGGVGFSWWRDVVEVELVARGGGAWAGGERRWRLEQVARCVES